MKRPLGQTLLIAVTVTLGAALMLFVFSGTVRIYKNPTASMEPTLPLGSRMAVLRSKQANRGDIIVFRYPLQPDVTFAKRVVAIEGDTVEIRAKQLIVNGKTVVEPYVIHEDDTTYPKQPLLPEPYRSRDNFGPFRVEPDHLFVLGDNRDLSSDSRYWGTVSRDAVKGHPILLFSPKRGVWRP